MRTQNPRSRVRRYHRRVTFHVSLSRIKRGSCVIIILYSTQKSLLPFDVVACQCQKKRWLAILAYPTEYCQSTSRGKPKVDSFTHVFIGNQVIFNAVTGFARQPFYRPLFPSLQLFFFFYRNSDLFVSG
jgi:hypothetical protein